MENSGQEKEKLLKLASRLLRLESDIKASDAMDDTQSLKQDINDFYATLKEIKVALIPISMLSYKEDKYEDYLDEVDLLQSIALGEEEFKDINFIRFSHSMNELKTGIEKNRSTMESVLESGKLSEWFKAAYNDSTEEEQAKWGEYYETDDGFDLYEYGEIGEEHMNSWFSHYDFGERILKAGIIIARLEKMPDFLFDFVYEIRQCFVFEQFLAVVALCRTALEISIRNLYDQNGFNEKNSATHQMAIEYFKREKGENWKKYFGPFTPSLDDMRNLLFHLPEYELLDEELGDLKLQMNRVIHGNHMFHESEAEGFMKRTFGLIHDLYDVVIPQ